MSIFTFFRISLTNIKKLVIFSLIATLSFLISLTPMIGQAQSSDYFYNQRLQCTNSYYNYGDYIQASNCYRVAWLNSCPVNQEACNKASNNIAIAMSRYKDEICNQKYYARDYAGASNCYQIGVNQVCNQNPVNDNLCNIFKSNKYLADNGDNSGYCSAYCNGNGNNYNYNYNYYDSNYQTQISRLKNYKDACNQNYYNGNYRAFVDCSQQGANIACGLSGYEAKDLCDRFNNNVNIGNNSVYYCNSGYYGSSSCSNVNEGTVNTIAAILTGGVVICAIAGCFNK